MGGKVSGKKTGVQLESHMVIRRPLVTEKGVHASERLNAYTLRFIRWQRRPM